MRLYGVWRLVIRHAVYGRARVRLWCAALGAKTLQSAGVCVCDRAACGAWATQAQSKGVSVCVGALRGVVGAGNNNNAGSGSVRVYACLLRCAAFGKANRKKTAG